PENFYARQSPVPVANPELIRVNHGLAEMLGIDSSWLESEAGISMVAGNQVPEGAEPIATVYAGHQFGHWNPRLGDGRAVLLGEVIGKDGERYDIQLKGSGLTPYSRNGDGRSPLGPVLREYIVSEAMAALGVPTSRSLAAVTSGEMVNREQRLAGGVLARVAKSHIRIGSFQYFASIEDGTGFKQLVEHVIARHYGDALDAENPTLALLEGVMQRQASLVALWQANGFIHGVMNTDNMLLSGETIDYGPCAFMDKFDSAALFSSIDQNGRYAYRNQPAIAHWNLACLGQTLLPLLADDEEVAIEMAQTALNKFPAMSEAAHLAVFSKKLGLSTSEADDATLIQDFLDLLESSGSDFTLAFRRLSELANGASEIESLFDFGEFFSPWITTWQQRCAKETVSSAERQRAMMQVNPVYIPRNHRVEAAINAAYQGDFSPFHRLVDRLARPYDFDQADLDLATPPEPREVVQHTFCGT
ncbi:MAG: hypothetical protein ACI8XW_003303, partial [Gammaproteobacteria bacterium]